MIMKTCLADSEVLHFLWVSLAQAEISDLLLPYATENVSPPSIATTFEVAELHSHACLKWLRILWKEICYRNETPYDFLSPKLESWKFVSI